MNQYVKKFLFSRDDKKFYCNLRIVSFRFNVIIDQIILYINLNTQMKQNLFAFFATLFWSNYDIVCVRIIFAPEAKRDNKIVTVAKKYFMNINGCKTEHAIFLRFIIAWSRSSKGILLVSRYNEIQNGNSHSQGD